MNIYTIYIHDDRYSIPHLDGFNAENDIEANNIAEDRLKYSDHYSLIEVWEGDREVGQATRIAS